MTLDGPTRILGVYAVGDYQCEDYGLTEPGDVDSLRPEDVWLEEDYPDWVYDHNGHMFLRLGRNEFRTVALRKLLLTFKT